MVLPADIAQALIVMLAHGIKPLHLRPDWKASLLVVLATALSFAGYELVRRVALLRILFGLSPGSTGPARLAGPGG